MPVGDRKLARGVAGEDGTGVAHPDAIGLPLVKVDTRYICAVTLQHRAGAVFGCLIVHQNVHIFDARQMPHDLRVDPGDGLEFAGPVLGVVRPGEPGGGVRLPFSGHAIGRLWP